MTFGVGHIFAAIVSGIPAPLPFTPFAFNAFARSCQLSALSTSFVSAAEGVGQDFATFSNPTVSFRPSGVKPVALVPGGSVLPPPGVSGAGVSGVGHDEQPFALMARACFCRAL